MRHNESPADRRTVLKSLGASAAGLAGGATVLSPVETVSAGYCGDQYSETSTATKTYWADTDSLDDYVEKELAEAVHVEVSEPQTFDNDPGTKYYVTVNQRAATYVKNTGDPQIDIMDQNVSVTYPDETETGAEWDFPDPDSEPEWLARASKAEPSTDGYDIYDLSVDLAAETAQVTGDVFERTLGSGVKLALDLYDYYNTVSSLANKFQTATSSTRRWDYSWTYSGDDATARTHTFMMFKVENIPGGGTEEHTIEVESRLDPADVLKTHTFDFSLEGARLCK
jgi:hypothetical protein